MKYQIFWWPEAEAAATEIWLGTRLRHAVSESMAVIDASLSVQPELVGESRSGRLRVATFGVLQVWFRVTPADLRVEILNVRFLGRSGRRQ